MVVKLLDITVSMTVILEPSSARSLVRSSADGTALRRGDLGSGPIRPGKSHPLYVPTSLSTLGALSV